MNLLQSLNEAQAQAVTAPPGNQLILAGAGSGKTRVLVHRIAWLMLHNHIAPYSILAVTFTNKAAYEMRSRIENLLNTSLSGMWVGTFHGLAHRLLRTHWQAAGLSESFQILDSDDQLRLIRRIHKNLELDENRWQPKQSQWFINKNKEEGRRPRDPQSSDSYFDEVMQKIYQTYEEMCRRNAVIDFAELLLRSLELLQKNEDIRNHYQQRFRHILVDEFQDTNSIQYAWLKLLAGDTNYLTVVGDDDQSIYSWRGAKIENIQRFPNDFSGAQVIRLEQNYRSTGIILEAANAVISRNSKRLGKNLWTEGEQGGPIKVYAAFNERDEAHYVVSTIREWVREGYDLKDLAILYRSNAQSRILEEQLIEARLAYHIYGGLKFFERAEIKDAVSYLRLIANRHDDAALERVINLPTRGIGETTLNELRTIGRDQQISLWQAAVQVCANATLSARALNALKAFIKLIDDLDQQGQHQTLEEKTSAVIYQTGLLEYHAKDKMEKGLSRVENLEELLTATRQFKLSDELENTTLLDAFLSHVTLETGEGQMPANSDCVHLMTLHSAKGLEFPIVFMVGMEEELFPHKMSMEEGHGLEEERRLCYVGMTRAMHKLYFSYAETRYIHGMEKFNVPSRFIGEVPTHLVQAVRPAVQIGRPVTHTWAEETALMGGLHIGQRVKHSRFGVGIIIAAEGKGEHTRVQVKFEQDGTKWLVASFAKLEPV
ncbi:MAG: DNA helicase II [Proteobacteria bacterium]|nr:DNA helicase II [Pseudomonadota bacterium]